MIVLLFVDFVRLLIDMRVMADIHKLFLAGPILYFEGMYYNSLR